MAFLVEQRIYLTPGIRCCVKVLCQLVAVTFPFFVHSLRETSLN